MLCHRTSSAATIRLQWLVGTSWNPPISALHSTGSQTCTSVPSSYMNAGDASPGPHYCSAHVILLELSPEPCVSVCPPPLLLQESLAHYAVQDGIKLVTLRSWFPGMHRHMTFDTYDRPWCWVRMGYRPVEAWFPLVRGRCVHMRGGLACAWKPTVLLYPSHSLFSACVYSSQVWTLGNSLTGVSSLLLPHGFQELTQAPGWWCVGKCANLLSQLPHLLGPSEILENSFILCE